MVSGGLEGVLGFSEGLAVAGLVVLAGVVVVDPPALGLLAVDVDVLLGPLVPAEEGGAHLLGGDVHPLEQPGRSAGKLTRHALSPLLPLFVLVVHVEQLSAQAAVLGGDSLAVVGVDGVEGGVLPIQNYHLRQQLRVRVLL